MQSLRAIVPNRPGLLAEITEVLASRGVDIQGIAVESHGSAALVRLEVEREDEALAALADAGHPAVTDSVLLARIEDRPGALAAVSRRLGDASINIRSLHHVRRDEGFAVVAISTDNNERARALLGEAVL